MVEASSKKVRGRVYPWGVAEVDSLDHCDFVVLRNMLIRLVTMELFSVPVYPTLTGPTCKILKMSPTMFIMRTSAVRSWLVW